MNVLAVRQDNVGDVLLAGPAVRALAAHAERLTFLCGPSGCAAAEVLPGVDDIVVCDAAWIEANPRAVDARQIANLIDRIAGARFDRAVIFTSYHQSPLPMALLLRLAGVSHISAISVDYPGSLLNVRHRVDDNSHEVERALSLAAAAGFAPSPNDDRRLAMRIAKHNPVANLGPYIVVHPGATVPARAWAPANNRALVQRLRERGSCVVVTGGVGEHELCGFVAGNDAHNIAGTTDLATLGRVIADAAAIVVGNTGAAHVAAAVGTPVVSLFAPTIPAERFQPWMVEHVLLGDQQIVCAGCRSRHCPIANQPCIGSVTVDEVIGAVDMIGRSREALLA